MKDLIKRVLNEKLGVPEGVLESSEELYSLLYKELNKIGNPPDESTEFKFRVDFTILNMPIKSVLVEVEFVETNQVDETSLISMSFNNSSTFSDDQLVLINVVKPGVISLKITFAGPEGTTNEDVLDLYTEQKDLIIGSLTHELTHAINFVKQKKTSLKSLGSYAGYQRTSFPFKPIQDFLYDLYFIHSIENIVRPAEVASLMRSGKIDREKFYDFLLNNRTYKILQNINKFTYQEMRENLKKDYQNILNFLDAIGVDTRNLNTEDEVVNELLRIVYVNLSNNTLESIRSMMTNNFMESILGFQPESEKDKLFDKLIGIFTKFNKNPEGFYKFEEKNFKMVSDKMIKKLRKLYDMANIDKSSIKDWDLHHKINKTGEQFETELKFKRKKGY